MFSHRVQNDLHTILLVAGMAILLGSIGYLLFGTIGLVILVLGGILLISAGPRVAPKLVLRMYKAKPVAVEQDTQLFSIVEALSKRAGLQNVPQLYYIPSQMINAFATGTRDNALIGVTDGILRALNGNEITAVLAHEMSHIKNNDIRVMSMADTIMRVTHIFSGIGQILLLLNLPLILIGKSSFSWLAIALLIFAPNITALMQLGLSRAREYDADVGAVDLTKDPHSLSTALQKIEKLHAGLLQKVMLPGRKLPEPSLLRTHPHTHERIERLDKMADELQQEPHMSANDSWQAGFLSSSESKQPRWHVNGLWF
ncbi:MAG: zinc metalloprotease HtpX [Gammaproteobacteria bacterium]